MQKDIVLPATLEAISKFNIELEQLLSHVPYNDRLSMVLALQELCVNIVHHAYAGAAGTIQIHIEQTPGQIIITCIDHAPNHLTLPEKIEMPSPLDLPESGMGLFIIYQTFDKVEYEPLPEGNRWRLIRQIVS